MSLSGPVPRSTHDHRAAIAGWLVLAGMVAALLTSPLQAGDKAHKDKAHKAGHPPDHGQPLLSPQPLSKHSLPLSFADAAAREHAQMHPECTCRAGGRSHQLGTQICLQGALFRCAMDLNVTSWQSLLEPCPQS